MFHWLLIKFYPYRSEVEESGPDEATLEKLVSSLRSAHNAEADKLRRDPRSHSKYKEQHQEFMEQAKASSQDCPMNVASIERVWTVYWKMQLENSFTKTWEKRVAHLISMVGKGKPLPEKTFEIIQRLTKNNAPEEVATSCEKFSASESNLLNRVKRHKTVSKYIAPKKSQIPEPASAVVLGERMLLQVQRSWKSMGCKASQKLLENAISKLDQFIKNPSSSSSEKQPFIELGVKLKKYKSFLISKEKNPYNLDYKSISAITATFSDSEIEEYIVGVLKERGVREPAREDLSASVAGIAALQRRSSNSQIGFVKGSVLNPH